MIQKLYCFSVGELGNIYTSNFIIIWVHRTRKFPKIKCIVLKHSVKCERHLHVISVDGTLVVLGVASWDPSIGSTLTTHQLTTPYEFAIAFIGNHFVGYLGIYWITIVKLIENLHYNRDYSIKGHNRPASVFRFSNCRLAVMNASVDSHSRNEYMYLDSVP